MQMARILAGYSGAEADRLRKAMGKKLPEEMVKYRTSFVEGCVAKGTLDADAAGTLFDKLAAFAGYGFNRSHSVEYTLISYQAMWMKTYWPVEFFAAALSMMKPEKLPAIVADARIMGIEIFPPDINQSSDEFEILTDTRLLIPFSRVKGIGAGAVATIMEGRKAGPFASMEDFQSRIDRRKCNKGHTDKLLKVGAFAHIVPGELDPKHTDRLMDQRELLPGLVSEVAPIARTMSTDRATKIEIAKLMGEWRDKHAAEGSHPKVLFGKAARFMVITDCPTKTEEREDRMAIGDSFEYTRNALAAAGLERDDAYWTALVKRPKAGKQVSAAELGTFSPYLDKEIRLLKPPAIIALGPTVARFFVPDLKGNINEHAGRIIYHKDYDTNVIIGFTPASIYYDPEKQDLLDALFMGAAELA